MLEGVNDLKKETTTTTTACLPSRTYYYYYFLLSSSLAAYGGRGMLCMLIREETHATRPGHARRATFRNLNLVSGILAGYVLR